MGDTYGFSRSGGIRPDPSNQRIGGKWGCDIHHKNLIVGNPCPECVKDSADGQKPSGGRLAFCQEHQRHYSIGECPDCLIQRLRQFVADKDGFSVDEVVPITPEEEASILSATPEEILRDFGIGGGYCYPGEDTRSQP